MKKTKVDIKYPFTYFITSEGKQARSFNENKAGISLTFNFNVKEAEILLSELKLTVKLVKEFIAKQKQTVGSEEK